MKSIKQLEEVYNKAKGDNSFYSFETFRSEAKEFLKDIKKHKVICSMVVSRSGMLRKFNFDKYNMLLNICYDNKYSWEVVKVGGCGMDMLWHLLYTTCEDLLTKKELEGSMYNSDCSRQKVL